MLQNKLIVQFNILIPEDRTNGNNPFFFALGRKRTGTFNSD